MRHGLPRVHGVSAIQNHTQALCKVMVTVMSRPLMCARGWRRLGLALLLLALSAYLNRSVGTAVQQHAPFHPDSTAPQTAAGAATNTTTAASAAAVVAQGGIPLGWQQAGRQLQGVPKNAWQFTGVRFESSMNAKASLVASRQMYTSYLQRMQRARSVQATWNTLRKKDKASLMASLGSSSALAEAALPETWDSRSLGLVTPPKDQGDCGTCVVHAVTAAAETAILMSRKGSWQVGADAVFDISEQQLYFCTDDKRSCSSGWDVRPALRQLVQLSRQQAPIYTSKCLKYQPDDFVRACKPSCQDSIPKGAFDWTVHDSMQSAQRAILRYGGVITVMWLTEEVIAFMTDPSKAKGVFKGQEVGVPHAVFVVGYSNPGQYWIVKNSYGTDTGDGGYLKVGYGEAGIMQPDHIYGLSFLVNPQSAARFAFNLARVPDSRDCYTYKTSKGDTVEWLCGRLDLDVPTVVADNRDALSAGINNLAADTKLKLCNIPEGRFRSAMVVVYWIEAQITREGYVYGRVDTQAATFYIFPMPGLGFDSAKSLCTKNGGELATYENSAEQRAIANGAAHMFGMNTAYAQGVYADYTIFLWLGYHKPRNHENWVNERGLARHKWEFENWYIDEPSAGSNPGDDRCALQSLRTLKGDKAVRQWRWLADACGYSSADRMSQGAVCRLPPKVAALGPEPKTWVNIPKASYRNGQTQQGLPYEELAIASPASDQGRFWLIRAKDHLPQAAAQQICEGEGGNLASIHSEQALNALHNMLKDFHWGIIVQTVWVGLYSDGPNQPLKWFDGSPVDFTKLPFGFPQTTAAIKGALYTPSLYFGGAYFYHMDVWTVSTLWCKLQ